MRRRSRIESPRTTKTGESFHRLCPRALLVHRRWGLSEIDGGGSGGPLSLDDPEYTPDTSPALGPINRQVYSRERERLFRPDLRMLRAIQRPTDVSTITPCHVVEFKTCDQSKIIPRVTGADRRLPLRDEDSGASVRLVRYTGKFCSVARPFLQGRAMQSHAMTYDPSPRRGVALFRSVVYLSLLSPRCPPFP